MIKKKITTIELSCKDEKTGEELFAVYKGGDEDLIQISKTAGKSQWFSFASLSEIVKSIDKWKFGMSSFAMKSPSVQDLREEKVFPGDIDTTEITSQVDNIQQQVDECMSRMSGDEIVSSLTKKEDNEIALPADPDLELQIDNEDPTGISPESIARLGSVPETPPEFKKQLQEIQNQRAGFKKPAVQKTIKRRDEE